MKINLKAIALLFTTLVIISCKKRENPVEDPGNKPDPVAHGTLIAGTAVQKTIGAAGGTISVPNSTISVVIPAGAVDSETSFSIQEVTNTLGVNGLGKSYRLLPENVQFKQDVEIAFKYTDAMLDGKFEDLLFMAYQDAKGYWRVPRNTVLDKANKTLKVKTRHFSDWSGYCSATLIAKKNRLAANEETILEGSYYFLSNDPENPNDDLLAPDEKADNEHIEEWKVVAGSGTLTPKANGTAIFKAPATITEPSVSKIQLKFKNIKNPRTGTEGLVLAYTNITLVPDQYLIWEFGGEKFLTGKNLITVGYLDSQKTGLAISRSFGIHINFNGIRTGEFEFGPVTNPGFSEVSAQAPIAGEPGYHSYKWVDDLLLYNAGKVRITSIKDDYIEGTFDGTLNQHYSDNPTYTKVEDISGSFRVKRPQ